MNIKIKLSQERQFLDALHEIDPDHKVNSCIQKIKYVTYIVPDEWYDNLHDFYKRQIEVFRVLS
jgi:hypothetical protein